MQGEKINTAEHESNFKRFYEIWGNEYPLGKLFKAGNNNYYYDTGTNKILSCDIDVFNLLNDIYLYGVEK